MEPVRTCLGCRTRADTSALLRIVARNGAIVPDPSATQPGRGAWVHPTPECVGRSISRRAFGRAFRVSTALDAGELERAVEQQHSKNRNDSREPIPGHIEEQAD